MLHGKAEAQARYNAGRRLAEQRDDHEDRLRGASDSVQEFASMELTSWQWDLLRRLDTGELLRQVNFAIVAWGHGRLRAPDGVHLDWVTPDWLGDA